MLRIESLNDLRFRPSARAREYSLLDGACRVKSLVQRAKELGMPAVALTDHGTLGGVVKFYRAAKEEGIKADHRPRALRGHRSHLAGRGQGEETPPHPARPRPDRLQEPRQALHARLSGGLLLQAARRLGPPRRAPRGSHRAHRLHERARRHASQGRQRRSRPRRGAAPGRAARPRERLRRAAGRRPARAARAASQARAARRKGRPAHRGHQRRALSVPRRLLRPRRASLHPDAEQHRRRGSPALRQRRVLPQVRRGDGGALQGLPRGLRGHRRDRRALRREPRLRQPICCRVLPCT